MRWKEKNINGQDEVKTELLLSLLFKMEEASIYLYADRKDPVEREKTDNAGKRGRTARVMSLNTQEWTGYSTQAEGLVLPKNRP